MAVTVNVEYTTRATDTKATALGNYTGQPKIEYTRSLSSTDVTKVYSSERTFTGTETIDVTNLTDTYGAAISFGTVKGIQVYHKTGANPIVFGGGANPLFGTDQQTVKTARTWVRDSEITVGAGAKNILVSAATAVTYQIIIFGS